MFEQSNSDLEMTDISPFIDLFKSRETLDKLDTIVSEMGVKAQELFTDLAGPLSIIIVLEIKDFFDLSATSPKEVRSFFVKLNENKASPATQLQLISELMGNDFNKFILSVEFRFSTQILDFILAELTEKHHDHH